MLVDLSISEYAAKLASKEPAPGGGSASALSGLLGVSLLEMVLNLTSGKPEFAASEEILRQKKSALADLHTELQLLVDLDASAFNALMAAYQMPKTTEDEKNARAENIQQSLIHAAQVPLQIARACLQALEIGRDLRGRINPHAASDLLIGALSCHAGVVGALLNTAINIPLIKDTSRSELYTKDIQLLRSGADELIAGIKQTSYSEPPFTVFKD